MSSSISKYKNLIKKNLSNEESEKFEKNVKKIIQFAKIKNLILKFKSLPFKRQYFLLTLAYKYKKVLIMLFGPYLSVHAGWEWYNKKMSEIKIKDPDFYDKIIIMEIDFRKSPNIEKFQKILKFVVKWDQ